MTSTTHTKTVRIGGASAFWGDTQTAAAQLVQHGKLDYLVFDYLAEVTMSILAGAKMRDPNAGYATDFVEVLTPLLAQIKNQKIKVIANAGGVNLAACRAALQAALDKAGIQMTVATVHGDDLIPHMSKLKQQNITEIDGNAPLPFMLLSLNAYLGALPIRDALTAGADIVITGRCVDSAVTLAPLMYEFGWDNDDYDRLAMGSLAGHIIECGAQCTGGNFTDWHMVADGYANMGFPIIEVENNGEFVVSKPENYGGLVSRATVGEQLLYEIGNPAAYLLPDVTCDFTEVKLTQVGENLVHVSGAKGSAPSASYKGSGTFPMGFRTNAMFMIGGIDAAAKARAVANAILTKTRGMFAEAKLGDYLATHIEILGAEDSYGARAKTRDHVREVVVKIAVRHAQKQALKIFTKEIAQAATGMSPGVTGYFAGRPKVMPVLQLYSCLIPKDQLAVQIDLGDGNLRAVEIPLSEQSDRAPISHEIPETNTSTTNTKYKTVRLLDLAWARSGDKGDHSNIGVMARQPEYLPWMAKGLTCEAVKAWFAHFNPSSVERWYLPNLPALNFLMKNALGGGGIASLLADPQGKCYAQHLLEFPIEVPEDLV